MLASTLLLAFLLSADVDEASKDAGEQDAERPVETPRPPIEPRRPVRKDEPLREVNISDIEVREIETLMKDLYPASIVYISPVTTGCPCEDGSDCTDQVWSIAQKDNRSYELSLSRIEDQWQVGPLQEWWLMRDRIVFEMNRWQRNRAKDQPWNEYYQTYLEFVERMEDHRQAYPVCVRD